MTYVIEGFLLIMLTRIDFTEKLVFESNMWIIGNTVKSQDCSVIQILRLINFGESRNSKTAILCNFKGSDFCQFGTFQHLSLHKVRKFKHENLLLVLLIVCLSSSLFILQLSSYLATFLISCNFPLILQLSSFLATFLFLYQS